MPHVLPTPLAEFQQHIGFTLNRSAHHAPHRTFLPKICVRRAGAGHKRLAGFASVRLAASVAMAPQHHPPLRHAKFRGLREALSSWEPDLVDHPERWDPR